MKTITLNTNIMCGACVAKVTQPLNEAAGENNWKIDLQNPRKILSVTMDKPDEQKIINALEKAGYKAETILQ